MVFSDRTQLLLVVELYPVWKTLAVFRYLYFPKLGM